MSDNDRWVEITILTSHEAVEAVSAILYDAGAAGVAIEDPKDIIYSNTTPRDWDYIDEKLLPEDTGEAKVKAYIPDSPELYKIVNTIQQAVNKLDEYGLNKGQGEIFVKYVKEQDWANEWKQYYKPFKIGEDIVIKPTWEEYDARQGDIIIELDPGMAFGTGTHETTKMCVEFLREYIKDGDVVFDVGCGSGILSIAASKLGAKKVIGVDIDEVAVRASKENVDYNGITNVEIRHGDMLNVIDEKADIVVANIIADAIISLSKIVGKFLKQGGIFISSGIIKDRYEDVKEALLSSGFEIVKVKEMGEWLAFAATLKE